MSILTTIGVGSGIDTSTLVSQLVAAQRESRDTLLTAKSTKLAAQVSGIATLKSGITNFSTALKTLIAGGTLATQPTSSDATVLGVSSIAGQAVPKTASSLTVTQLAAAQSVASGGFPSADAPIGTGSLTFTFGSATVADGAMIGFSAKAAPAAVTVDIDSSNNTLAGIAAAINGKNAGLQASVVTDASGARLVVKGVTGAASAFTISAAEDAGSPGLAALSYGPTSTTGATLKQQAKDAILSLDGVEVSRSSNSVADLLTGVKLELKGLGTATIGASSPVSAISSAVTDFVGAYNEVQALIAEQTDKDTGTLNGDPAVRQMKVLMGKLTSTALRSSGHPATLAEIGVATNRDGTLTLDSAALASALAAHPDEIEAMFNPSQSSSSALVRIVSANGTVPGGTYSVENLVAATSGTLTGAAVPSAFASPLTLDGTNNSFTVALDGRAAVTVTLPEGDYPDGESFAAALSAAVAANPLINVRAAIGWSGDQLRASSGSTGSLSSISITAADSTIATTLGLDAAVSGVGHNASGAIAGKPAVASGGLLFADSSTAAKGLCIQPVAGATSATIGVDQGLFNALNAIATALTGTNGALYTANTRLTTEQKGLTTQQAKVASDAELLKTRLTTAFSAMDAKVAAYKSTQSFLTQQIAAWNKSDS